MTTIIRSPHQAVIARLRASRLNVPDPFTEQGHAAGQRWAAEQAEWWQLVRLARHVESNDSNFWKSWNTKAEDSAPPPGPQLEPLFVHIPRIAGELIGVPSEDLSLAAESWWSERNAPEGLEMDWIVSWVEGALKLMYAVESDVSAP